MSPSLNKLFNSIDCQAVISTLMRHAVSKDDEQMIDDLRILENTLHTRHFRNALKVKLLVCMRALSVSLFVYFVYFVYTFKVLYFFIRSFSLNLPIFHFLVCFLHSPYTIFSFLIFYVFLIFYFFSATVLLVIHLIFSFPKFVLSFPLFFFSFPSCSFFPLLVRRPFHSPSFR